MLTRVRNQQFVKMGRPQRRKHALQRLKCMSKSDLHDSGADTMLIQEAVSPSLQL